MAFLGQADKDRIAEAIRQAELKTSGELVALIAGASDGYYFIPLLWASLVALMVPGIFWVAGLELGHLRVYELQLATFLALGILFRWTPLKMRLIPKAVKHMRTSRLAREQFYVQGLHLTRDRTGILLFVSVAEHYVELVADQGINERVEPGSWDHIVEEFLQSVRQGKIAEGFLTAVGSCGAVLEKHFPRPADDTNELPNHLIEI
jgi:putative membrane protein